VNDRSHQDHRTTQPEPETAANPHQRVLRERVAAVCFSVVCGVLLLAVKFWAYHLTHSSAILSDALESIINVVAGGFAAVSILLAARPPDASHPYGHGKIEFFSAGFEGALIIIAAFGIFKAGITRILTPQELPNLDRGLLLILAASAVNLVLGIGLIRVGRRTGSITLVADGKHVLTDVYTSGGVLFGLLLVKTTGWYGLDGGIACLVGVNILITGSSLVRQSFHGLMDAADPRVLDEVAALLKARRKENWIDIHQLRAWRSGDHIHVDMHLVLPRDCSLEEAHTEARAVEDLVIAHFKGRASALIHMDPCIEPDCPVCRQHVCGIRSAPADAALQWDRETLTTHKGRGEFLRPKKSKPAAKPD
jgi:cation diffusion facilitator family transporter